MSNLQAEKVFFHDIAKIICNFINHQKKDIVITKHKRIGDFATQIDVDVENLIVTEIKNRFPEDRILAEEEHNQQNITKGRVWIIDPICGTNNLARDIKNFCTNIALAEDGILIASCVIDHSHNDYIWSIGDQKIYLNDQLLRTTQERFDTYIDVDFGPLAEVNLIQKEKHNTFLKNLITTTNFYLISLNSSLGFAYTAIGKVDGFLTIYNKPWDICAASFLIQQSLGIITDLSGNPWAITSIGAIGAKNKKIHTKLLEAFNNNSF